MEKVKTGPKCDTCSKHIDRQKLSRSCSWNYTSERLSGILILKKTKVSLGLFLNKFARLSGYMS